MLDNFAVIIDYFNDFLASSDVVVPVAIAMLVGALVIFAWRSTEGKFVKKNDNFFEIIKISKKNIQLFKTIKF